MSPTARMRSVRSDGLIRPFHSPTVVDGRVRVRDRRGRLSTHYKSVALSTDPNDYAESALLLAGELDFLMSTRARARRTHPPRIVADARWVRTMQGYAHMAGARCVSRRGAGLMHAVRRFTGAGTWLGSVIMHFGQLYGRIPKVGF
jgi:hypothetical protein